MTSGSQRDGSGEVSWQTRYAQARLQLVNGDFKRCAELFTDLKNDASGPVQPVLANELQQLCSGWDAHNLVMVSRKGLEESNEVARTQDKRTTDEISVLYMNSVVYGIGTGAWVGVLAEPESPAGFILPTLAFAGASAGIVAVADMGRGLRYGGAQSIVSGMYVGLETGLAWTIWNQARSNYADQWSEKTVASIVWGTSTAGALAGGIIGATVGTTPGRAAFVSSTSLWTGAVLGLATVGLTTDDHSQDDNAMLAAAVGVSAGTLGGLLAAGPVSPSIARVRYLDLGALSGGLLLGGLAVAGETEDNAAALLASMGIFAGLGASWWLTSSMHADRPNIAPEARPELVSNLRLGLAPSSHGMSLSVSGQL